MKFDTFTLDTDINIKKYNDLLVELDVKEPYYRLDYLDVFCEGIMNVRCFYYKNLKLSSSILLIGYLNPVKIGNKNTSYFDFITPYGYGGPIYSNDILDTDIKVFWDEMENWGRNHSVVTEFIRFNLFNNQEYYTGSVFPTMLNVKGAIIGEEEQWRLFDRKVRKNVNKAKRENLVSKISYIDIQNSDIVEFFGIYTETMARTNAEQKFFYSLEQFESFIKNNKENCAICNIYHEGIAISSELILVSKDSVYSFLGGTNEEYFDKRPNDFLKVEVINWARSQGKSFYILGGGYGFEDGIFKYKKCFFPNDVVPYYTGRKVLNNDVYDELVEQANEYRDTIGLSLLVKDDTSFFPLYNKKD